MRTRYEQRNLRLLSSSYRKDVNKVKISSSNTYTHEIVKTFICYLLRKNKCNFITEGIFENGGRCDVFDITNGIIYEVLYSEKVSNITNKKSYYPDVEIIAVNAKEYKSYSLEKIKEKLSSLINIK